MTWQWAYKCGECGNALQASGRHMAPRVDSLCVLCSECGASLFEGPFPVRTVSVAIWWNPLTWFATKYEWREDIKTDSK